MTVIVPRDSASEKFGTGLGQGISSGIQAVLNQRINQLQQQHEQQAAEKNLLAGGFDPQMSRFLASVPSSERTKLIGQLWQRPGGGQQNAPQPRSRDDILASIEQLGNLKAPEFPSIQEVMSRLANKRGQETGLEQFAPPNIQQNASQNASQNVLGGNAQANQPVQPAQKPLTPAEIFAQQPRLRPEAEATLKQSKELATQKLNAAEERHTLDRFDAFKKESVPAARAASDFYHTATELKDVLSRGNVNLGDVIQNKFVAKEYWSADTQRAAQLADKLVTDAAALGKGVASGKRIEAIKAAKLGLYMQPKAFRETLDFFLKDPSLLKDAAEGKAIEEFTEKWGGNVPKNFESEISKRSKELSKNPGAIQRNQPIQIGQPVDQVAASQIVHGASSVDENGQNREFWDANLQKWIPEAEFNKGA